MPNFEQPMAEKPQEKKPTSEMELDELMEELNTFGMRRQKGGSLEQLRKKLEHFRAEDADKKRE